jgi:hypothetical protein
VSFTLLTRFSRNGTGRNKSPLGAPLIGSYCLLSCCGDTAFLTIRRTCSVRPGPSLRDLIPILAAYPAPRRWGKVARPFGTLVRPARSRVGSAESEPTQRRERGEWGHPAQDRIKGHVGDETERRCRDHHHGCNVVVTSTLPTADQQSPEGELA